MMSFDVKDTNLGTDNKENEEFGNEGRLSIKSMTHSVIRRGLCMVRDEGNYKFWKHEYNLF